LSCLTEQRKCTTLGESAQDNAQAVHVETFRSGGFLYHRFAACQVVKVFSTHSLACVLVRPAVAFTCEGIILGSLVFERWHAERTVAGDRLRVAPRRQRRLRAVHGGERRFPPGGRFCKKKMTQESFARFARFPFRTLSRRSRSRRN
jgi:hypothetical protein